MEKLFLLSVLAVLLSCSGQGGSLSDRRFIIDSASSPDIQNRAVAVLPKLLGVCPGLDTYAADLNDVRATKAEMRGFEGGISIRFFVNENPSVLPSPLNVRSAGHRCDISVDPGQTKAYIAKRACHSVCVGRWRDNSPSLMGREFRL